MAATAWFCVVLLCVSFVEVTCGEDNVDRLYKNVTETYIKDIRPTRTHSEATQVHMKFRLTSIKEFVEKKGHFAMIGVFNITWKDHRISWDPNEYGGLKEIIIRQEKVWIPQMIFGNSYSDLKSLGRDWVKVRYQSDGTATWRPVDLFDFTCAADVTFYPFDKHTCHIYIIPEGYYDYEIKVTTDTKIDISWYFTNPLWNLDDTEIGMVFSDSVPVIDMQVMFSRIPTFYIVNLMLPVAFIGLLGTLVFWLPVEGGRVGFSVTALLSMTVFLTIVSDSLPTSANPNLSRLSYSLLADLGIGILITLCTIVGLRIHHNQEDQEVPKYLRCLVALCCIHKKKIYYEESLNNPEDDIQNVPNVYRGVSAMERTFNMVIDRKSRPVKHMDNYKHVKRIKQPKITWKDVGKCLDIIFFVNFLTIIVFKNVLIIFLLV